MDEDLLQVSILGPLLRAATQRSLTRDEMLAGGRASPAFHAALDAAIEGQLLDFRVSLREDDHGVYRLNSRGRRTLLASSTHALAA